MRSPSDRSTWIIVVDDATTSEGEARRRALVDAIRETAAAIATRQRDRWVEIDARAIVAFASSHELRSSQDDAELAWSELDATAEGAARFSDAIARAIRASVASGSPDVRAAITAASARIDPDDIGKREIIVVVPEERGREDLYRHGDVAHTFVRGEDLNSAVNGRYHPWSWCPERPIERCSIRVHLETGTCDPSRGLRPATTRDPEDEILGRVTCDVALLDGEAARRCEDRRESGRALPGGFCLTRPWYCPRPMLRIVGGALADDALAEITCNLQ